MTERDFACVETYLERTLANLKETKDPKSRRDLLLEMRLLLEEADRLLLESAAGLADQ